jgi:hypothetical protein
MTEHKQLENEVEIINRLNELRYVPPRNLEKAAEGRRHYLTQVNNLSKEQASLLPVSILQRWRLNGWIGSIINPLSRKERYPMFATISSIAVVLALVFGGAGATVAAAQGSQPNDSLYQLKLFSEDVRQEIAGSDQGQFELSLRFAERRMEEIGGLIEDGEEVPEPVMERMEEQLRNALRAAAGMPDGEMQGSLEQLRERIQERLQNQNQTGSQAPDTAAMERMREMLRETLRNAEGGLDNPEAFRWQYQNENQYGNSQNTGEENSDNGQETAGEDNNSDQGTGTDPNSEVSTDPQQEPAANGPGPEEKSNSQGYGPGPVNQEPPEEQGFGPGPNPDPGSGAFGSQNGVITSTEEVEDPLGLGNQNGPQGTQSGSGTGQEPNQSGGGEKEKDKGSEKSSGGGGGSGKGGK